MSAPVDSGAWVRAWSSSPVLDAEARAMLPLIARVAERNGGTFTVDDVAAELLRSGGDA